MRRLFLLLLVLLISVWVGLRIAKDPGYAVFGYQNWTVEMPLWFAILAFILVVFLLYVILRFFDSIDFSLYRWRNWLVSRKKYKAYSRTNKGLVELIEGQWKTAECDLREGVGQSDAPLINYLAAAKAAHEQKAYNRRDIYLRKAHQLSPRDEVAIGLTQAQLQFEQGQFEQAAATLEHVRRIVPKHPFVLQLLERVYIRLSDWTALLKILPSLKKVNLITEEQFIQFEINTYKEILSSIVNKKQGLDSIQAIWKTFPKTIQKTPEMIYGYALAVLAYPEAMEDIDILITKALKKQWNRELVYIYGLLRLTDPKKQLAQAEDWKRQYGSQSILLLTLGKLAMQARLWGKARQYFEESIKLESHPEAYMEYGKLLTELGELSLASDAFRKGLELADKTKAGVVSTNFVV